MASVSSLDQDMRKLRMDRYTPQAAAEVRSWIESTLQEQLHASDLLEVLKDGVALCKLANLVLPPPGIRFKASNMPFTQRENIAQFLTACERPPLNLPAHDRFLTVDLYDAKDPAQVIQCIGAFSRAANAVQPSRFPHVIGPRRAGASSPTRRGPPANGAFSGSAGVGSRTRNISNASQDSGSAYGAAKSPNVRAMSPALSGGSNSSARTGDVSISSWSNKKDEGNTAPAWNIHQYGYMGGASQGNQGISFGGRRQITSASPTVPSLADKERRRKEQEMEAERQRLEREDSERRRRAEREQEEARLRHEEEQRLEEEARRTRDAERAEVERQKRKWEEEERRWKEEEEARRREEEQQSVPGLSPSALRGQLSSQSESRSPRAAGEPTSERQRIAELEKQLQEAKERERQYQLQREQRETPSETSQGQTRPPDHRTEPDMDGDSIVSEASYLQDDSLSEREKTATPRPLPTPAETPAPPTASAVLLASSTRQLPTRDGTSSVRASPFSKPMKPFERPVALLSGPQASVQPAPPPPATAEPPRPLPSRPAESTYTQTRSPFQPRTAQFLSSHPAPSPQTAQTHASEEYGGSSTGEREAEDNRRKEAQNATKAGGWASKSLLEREMERERERQREWEEAQMKRDADNGGARVRGPRQMGAR